MTDESSMQNASNSPGAASRPAGAGQPSRPTTQSTADASKTMIISSYFPPPAAGASAGSQGDSKSGGAARPDFSSGFYIAKSGAWEPQPAPADPGYTMHLAAQFWLRCAVHRGAERLAVSFTEPAAIIRLKVDGVSYRLDKVDPSKAKAVVAYLLRKAGVPGTLNASTLSGDLRVLVDGAACDLKIIASPGEHGPLTHVFIDAGTRHRQTLATLGLAPRQLESLRQTLATRNGIALASAPAGQGMTTLLYAMTRYCSPANNLTVTIECTPIDRVDDTVQWSLSPGATPDEELFMVTEATRRRPAVVMVDDLQHPQSAAELAEFARGGGRVLAGLRSGDALHAIELWRQMAGDDALGLDLLDIVVACALPRKLCPACRVEDHPDADGLRALGLPVVPTARYFKPADAACRPTQGPVACKQCNDLGYNGRLAIFETLKVDNEIRRLLKSHASEAAVQAALAKQGQTLLQSAADHLQKGDTSVDELRRVLVKTTTMAG
jgi:general secretion pathway protein E